MTTHGAVYALILAGGSGTRLWPRSTDSAPKPFLALTGPETLLSATFRRASALAGADRVLVSARVTHAALIRRDLAAVSGDRLVLEPERRNTAPAIALSALSVAERDREAVLVVLPSDQAVADEAAFQRGVETAVDAARHVDGFVTLGITPVRPETGFGYLETDPAEAGWPVRRVVRFVEKPPAADAERFLASGLHFWNAGIFVFRVPVLLDAMERLCPDILGPIREAASARKAGDAAGMAKAFGRARRESIDYAVMEKATTVVMVPCDCGWSDVGSWDAVHDFRAKDEAGNVLEGPAQALESRGCLALARKGRPVTLIGVDDLVVVDSEDGLLVTRRGASDALRRAVESRLAKEWRP
ncbi:MAG: mannose-1-phosphate guanylyltransferase [Acidobacteria bacterium]|nr:MAG: mannose-1-phosphate guanylyltransferase [Acidobacteriota bacterium]MCE7958209.1 mannose-1-phosphate guanylyltransferase [Acidobacteria bacterium ACB2]